jgi:protein gp37
MTLAGTRLQHHPSRAGLTVQSSNGPVWNGEVRFNEEWLDQPLKWGRPRRIFVCAHGDLFHKNVPVAWIDRVFAVMGNAFCMDKGHIFQVLTKRADRMQKYLSDPNTVDRVTLAMKEMGLGLAGENAAPVWPLPNVWVGVSVENQDTTNERVPLLLKTPAAIRWISAEPLLERIEISFALGMSIDEFGQWRSGRGLDWVVVGGESGHSARPVHPDWARLLRDECVAAGTPFLFKQWGEHYPALYMVDEENPKRSRWHVDCETIQKAGWHKPHEFGNGIGAVFVGKKIAGRLLDGVLYDQYPGAVKE